MILNLSKLSAPIHFPDLFRRKAPVEIEVGVGKGRFLKEYAPTFPDRNLLGIEKSRKWISHAAARLEKAEVENVHLVQCYVEGFLERFVPEQSIQAFHINFPDPWPKKRHHKRRLVNRRFIKELLRILEPGGHIYIATDHQGYNEEIQEVLRHFSGAEIKVKANTKCGAFQSNYEAKYKKEGREINYTAAMKLQ